LREVIDFYDRGGDEHDGIDPQMQPLGLSEGEKADLLAFLTALEGEPPSVDEPVLPRARVARGLSPRVQMRRGRAVLDAVSMALARPGPGIPPGVADDVDRLLRQAESTPDLLGVPEAPADAPFNEAIGELILELRRLSAADRSGSLTAAVRALGATRRRCDACHEQFRPDEAA
jgi:hypothetical protein